MDVTVELGIAAKVHDDMTGKPNTMADAIRRGIAEIERLRTALESSREVNAKLCQRRDEMDAEIAELRARAKRAEGRIAEAPVAKVRGKVGELATICVSHSLVGKRVALGVVDE